MKVQGVDELTSCEYSIMSDRIEAGTYLCAAAITDGELLLEGCPFVELDSVISKLSEMGVSIVRKNGAAVAGRGEKFNCVDVVNLPYPGFPTDMQAQVMALMTLAEGSGVIKETIFENRFMHVPELSRMGANIKLSGNSAVVRGVSSLKGAPVMASDLRASASLVIAGLAAGGKTEVSRIYHLDRGYESMEKKLGAVGARVKRVSE
jgi:UDP-N-acetylglucosamine 1-carboxyvinyltransferase